MPASRPMPLCPVRRAAAAALTVLAVGACGGSPSGPAATSGGEGAGRPEPAPGAEPEAAASAAARRATGGEPFATATEVAPGLAALPGERDCAADADCVVTTFTRCCEHDACPEDARVVSGAWLARAMQTCGEIECASPEVVERPACLASVPAVVAACEAGACVGRPAGAR